jgi:hypothetical protein
VASDGNRHASRSSSAHHFPIANSSNQRKKFKFRTNRRPGLPIDPIWRFYPRYCVETIAKITRWAMLYMRLRALYLRIIRAMPPKEPCVLRKLAYTDLAMTPVSEHDAETHELFNNEAPQAYIGQERRLMDVRRAAGKPAQTNSNTSHQIPASAIEADSARAGPERSMDSMRTTSSWPPRGGWRPGRPLEEPNPMSNIRRRSPSSSCISPVSGLAGPASPGNPS